MNSIQSNLLSVGAVCSLGVSIWSCAKSVRIISARGFSWTEKVRAVAPYALLTVASFFLASRGRSYLPSLQLNMVQGIGIPLCFFACFYAMKNIHPILRNSRRYSSWTAKIRAMAPYLLLIGATYGLAWQVGKYQRR